MCRTDVLHRRVAQMCCTDVLHRCVAETTESCPTYKWVMPHVFMSQAAPMTKSHHSNEGLPAWMKTPYLCRTLENLSLDTHEGVRHTWRSQTHMKESSRTSCMHAHVFSRWLCTRLFKKIMYTSFQHDYVHVFSRGLCTTRHVIWSMWFQESRKEVCMWACKDWFLPPAQTTYQHTHKTSRHIWKSHATHMKKSRHTYQKVIALGVSSHISSRYSVYYTN